MSTDSTKNRTNFNEETLNLTFMWIRQNIFPLSAKLARKLGANCRGCQRKDTLYILHDIIQITKSLKKPLSASNQAQGKENPDEQQSSSSEDQEDNEQSDDSEIDDYEEQSFEVLFIPEDSVECVAVRWIKVRIREGGGGGGTS